jgi:hypothetical protein
MKTKFIPIKLSGVEEYIMKNESLSRKGFHDVANGILDYADMSELMLKDYVTRKFVSIQKRIYELKKNITEFNEDIELVKSMGIHTNMVGEPLKKIELNIEYNFV